MFAKQKKICRIENTKLVDLRPIKNENGTELIKEPEKIHERWKEHFSSVLNREIPIAQLANIQKQLNQQCQELARPVTRNEVIIGELGKY